LNKPARSLIACRAVSASLLLRAIAVIDKQIIIPKTMTPSMEILDETTKLD
jgi:hypothetical protein